MEYRYKSRFDTVATISNPEESDRFIAKASLLPLKGLLPPDVKPEDSPDMLFFSCNGAVAGLCNKNGDAITTETALLINKSSKNKYVSIDHDREQVCGLILQPGFTRFGTNEPLTDEEAAKLNEPFNMAFVGALWKVINPMMAKYIQKQGDSIDKDVLSMSWEIAFNDYDIGIGSKNLFDAQIITDEDINFNAYANLLRSNGGAGVDNKGDPVFRIIKGEPVILGYSIVANPAAEVKGILPLNNMMGEDKKSEEKINEKAQENQEKEVVQAQIIEIISEKIKEKNINLPNNSVTSNTRKIMKIEKFEQIESDWNEIRKLETAASIVDFVKAIQDGSEEYVKKLEERENALKLAEEAKASSEKALKETQEVLAEVKKELEEIRASQEAAKIAETFQARMQAVDSEFDLDDEDRQLIASDIKDLDDESFAKYMAKCKKLMSSKMKKAKMHKEMEDEEMEEECEAAKTKEHTTEMQKQQKEAKKEAEMVKAAVASVTEDQSQTKVPNTMSVEPSLFEQMQAAFAESFKIDGQPVSRKKK